MSEKPRRRTKASGGALPNRTPAEETAGITKTPAAESPDPDTKSKLPKKKKDSYYVAWKELLLASALTVAVFIYARESPIKAAYYELEPPPALAGPLAENDYIQRHGKRLYLTRLFGPEHIEPCEGALYTGTRDSKIWRLAGEQASVLANPGGPKCSRLDSGEEYADCGRPLGIRCANGSLYVADANLGLYRVSIGNGDVTRLIRANEKVDGLPTHNLNAVELLPDGSFVLSQPDATRPHSENVYSMLEHLPNGRLLIFDPKKGSEVGAIEVLKTGLYFPNGVVLTHDKTAILFAETAKTRVMKLHIEGPKKGQVEPFALNLPGLPDNLARSSDGGYWVAIVSPRNNGSFDSYGFVGRHPRIRNWITKLIPRTALAALSLYFPATYVVKLDADGRVVGALHDPSHGVAGGHITHAIESDGALLLGSSLFNYVVRVDLLEYHKLADQQLHG